MRADEVGMLNINPLTAGSRKEKGVFSRGRASLEPSVPPITSMLREKERAVQKGKEEMGGGETRERRPGKIRTEMPFVKGSITTPRTQKSQRDF